MVIRVLKEHAAFFYQLLESYEGLTSYSTVSDDKGLNYRDIELFPAPHQQELVEKVLVELKKELPFERIS